jgi:iron complex outermembrane receptor protein
MPNCTTERTTESARRGLVGARTHACAFAIGLAGLLSAASGLAADPQPTPAGAAPLSGDLSFEQLMAMEVSGVSKSAERTLDAPAAVTVIGSAELRAFGFRTLAEVLAVAPGYFAYDDRAYGYVGVGGLAPIGGSNSRVLLLIDGFPTNDNVFEQALLGSEAIIDLDLIDRIEIIRGPSSSVYGANAFFGVINVILKTPAQLDSGAQVWLGSNQEHGASATLSGAGGADLRYFLRASVSGTDGADVSFDPQAGIPASVRYAGVDGTDITRFFSKIIDGNLRLNLGFSDRRQQAGYGLHGDQPGDSRSWLRDGDAWADLRYEGTLGSASDYALRASLAQYRYDATIVDDPAAPNAIPAQGDWLDTEATYTHRFSAHNRLVLGTELRRDLREELTQSNSAMGTFQHIDNSAYRFGFYVQSDVDWSAHWSSSLGLRDDRNDDNNRVDPRFALLYKPDERQVVKLMAGSAFRQASLFEGNFAQPPSFLTNPRLTPERIRTVDLAYEAQLSADTRTSVTLFRYRALDLINQVLLDPATGSSQFQNIATARAQGVDVALEQALGPRLQLRLSGSYANATDENGNWLQNSPRWTGRLGAQQQFAEDWRLAAETLYVGNRLAFDNSPIAGYLTANATVSSQPRRGRLSCSLGIYNLFDRGYAQPLAGLPRVNEPGRTWRAALGYSF